MILVDTSVWIDHLRVSDDALRTLLDERRALVHPFVTGEIALGHVRQRELVVNMLESEKQAVIASNAEVMHLIKSEHLFGTGIGYVDSHLLASVCLTPGSLLWTRDKRLNDVSKRLRVSATIQ